MHNYMSVMNTIMRMSILLSIQLDHMRSPEQISDVFVNALKCFIESTQNFNMVLSELFIQVL